MEKDFNKISKILITGSSGTIGTRLFETLLELGFDVYGVDKVKNIWKRQLNERTLICDLRKIRTLRQLPKKFDLIIHLAANARVYNLVLKPSMAFDNTQMTYNILEFARLNNISKFIFASSREVYGNSSKILHKENDISVSKCESTYTASKIAGEALVQAYRRCYNFETVITRFSNVYGMYDVSDRFVPLIIDRSLKNQTIDIYGKNKMLDFTFIDDTVRGLHSVIRHFSRASKCGVYNLASGKGNSLIEVANIIKKLTKSKSLMVCSRNRTGEVLRYIANITRAKKDLYFKPKYNLQKGLEKAVIWYKKNFFYK